MKNKIILIAVSFLIVFSILLGACTPKSEDVSTEKQENVQSEDLGQSAEANDEEVAADETENVSVEESADPTTFVYAISVEPDSLDSHKTGAQVSNIINMYMGSSLIIIDENGDYHPYLAESWDVSDDGLTYTFYLRQDVLFHDGTSLTAADYAFTFNRALDPETMSPAAGPALGPVASVEALDDYTLVFTLTEPYFPFLFALSDPSYMAPMSQAYVEENGDDYLTRNPMGVGPYQMSEWVTGDYILLEKNLDFNWGPETWENTGPWNIDYIKFRVIPEEATIIAGLESGELHYSGIEAKDLTYFEELGFSILEVPQQGLRPYIALQTSVAPMDDINVRKALNMAINREAALQLLEQGNGVIQYGPLSPSQIGYWSGVEELGYAYDLEGAKALLEESGYTLNADGYYEKDDLVLSFTLYTLPIESWVKAAEVVQSMFKDIGVEANIVQEEQGVVIPKVMGGDYQMTMFGMTEVEADILYKMFHSSNIGGFNYAYVNNPELDAILERTRTETDPEARQEAVIEAQSYIAQQAYFVPMYAPINFSVVSPSVKNIRFSPLTGLMLDNAVIEK